jgi:hypothetical protein
MVLGGVTSLPVENEVQAAFRITEYFFDYLGIPETPRQEDSCRIVYTGAKDLQHFRQPEVFEQCSQ